MGLKKVFHPCVEAPCIRQSFSFRRSFDLLRIVSARADRRPRITVVACGHSPFTCRPARREHPRLLPTRDDHLNSHHLCCLLPNITLLSIRPPDARRASSFTTSMPLLCRPAPHMERTKPSCHSKPSLPATHTCTALFSLLQHASTCSPHRCMQLPAVDITRAGTVSRHPRLDSPQRLPTSDMSTRPVVTHVHPYFFNFRDI